MDVWCLLVLWVSVLAVLSAFKYVGVGYVIITVCCFGYLL